MFNSITYFQKIKQFFLVKGKKSTIEKLLANFLLNRAKFKKDSVSDLIEKCILNGTTFVQLKTRRRGKRVKHKVGFVEKNKAEDKALGSLRKIIREQNSNSFLTGFEKEMESLSLGKSALITKRDEIHRLALQNVPFAWISTSKRKQKSLKKAS